MGSPTTSCRPRPTAARDPGAMRRTAFTLIETLITTALLVLLAAVVLPNIGSRVGERRFRDAQQRVALAAVMCRAEAMRSADARLLVAREDADHVWRFYAEPYAPEPEDTGVSDPLSVEAWTPEPARQPLLELPEGCSIAGELPETRTDDRFGPPGTPELDPDTPPVLAESEPGPAPSFRLAAFLPDGRAVTPAELYLLGPDARAATIRVSLWTGSARVEPIDAEPADGTPDELGDLAPPAEPAR